MGRYFGNIHSFVDDDDRLAVTNRVASAVSRWVTAGPFREISAEDPTLAHRTMLIQGGPRWISVFCSEAARDEGATVAEHIARDADLSTLWFRVLDGSLVCMRLYDKGGEVDRAVVDVDPSDPDGMHAIAQEPTAAVWDRLT